MIRDILDENKKEFLKNYLSGLKKEDLINLYQFCQNQKNEIEHEISNNSNMKVVIPFTTITVHQIAGGPAVVKVTKPAQVKSLKAKVVKSKKAKKSVKLTWKKASRAKGYQVYVSKKNKKHFKKSATVKKTKKTLKLKKGTYYVKVRAIVGGVSVLFCNTAQVFSLVQESK